MCDYNNDDGNNISENLPKKTEEDEKTTLSSLSKVSDFSSFSSNTQKNLLPEKPTLSFKNDNKINSSPPKISEKTTIIVISVLVVLLVILIAAILIFVAIKFSSKENSRRTIEEIPLKELKIEGCTFELEKENFEEYIDSNLHSKELETQFKVNII